MITIDCRNLACPAPVIKVKKALETLTELRVVLDDGAPRENVTRFAHNRGCQIHEERADDAWALTIHASGQSQRPFGNLADSERILLITSDRLGDGPEELGRLLMRNFIHTLLELDNLPSQMFFVNTGVLLTTEGSEVLEALEKLAGMGVEVLSCGLCLDFFRLKDKLKAGSTTNMLMIAETLLSARPVLRI
ncbi:sulfurtransferase-like selenium metabolism protein YedF [Geobacter sp. FeAm09]|uniref:sulfurtransferase-like selenium metabolism protein YedF n=1 Tax=Geobacter sp. FeAm09 TaxID=2597769 RepID=UPI0011EE0BC3|nr:sulfurtransferase-like selenium metabolism protein YedF [Geobacter sp. FeAm09]QEM69484.1 sulfurtransferase-like selenium metabolism protein YedF [Geobacter sp. FeAm09]